MTFSDGVRDIEQVLECLPAPLLLFSPTRELLAVNSSGLEFLRAEGLLPADLVQRSTLGGVSLDLLLRRVLEGHETSVSEDDPASPEGRLRNLRASRIVREDGTVCALLLVSPSPRSQWALAEEQDRADVVARLLPGVAHEIRGPLTTISGVAQIMTLSPELTGDCRDGLELVRSQVERADTLLRNYVAFVRGPKPNAYFPISLNDSAQRAMQLLAHDIRVAHIELTDELFSDLPLIAADPEELTHVVLAPLAFVVAAVAMSPGKRCIQLRTRELPQRIAALEFWTSCEPDQIVAEAAFRLAPAQRIAERLGGSLEIGGKDAACCTVKLPGWTESGLTRTARTPEHLLIAEPDPTHALAMLAALGPLKIPVTLATSEETVSAALRSGNITAAWVNLRYAEALTPGQLPSGSLITAARGQDRLAQLNADRLGCEWAPRSRAARRWMEILTQRSSAACTADHANTHSKPPKTRSPIAGKVARSASSRRVRTT